MFCSECGKPASGKFCANCGSALQTADGQILPHTPPLPSAGWQHEMVYGTLILDPEVRDMLAREVPSSAQMTGEQFLTLWEKAIPAPVSLVSVAKTAQGIYSGLGVHTAKSRSALEARPIGRVIVSALCALARLGCTVTEARQVSDGCLLICSLPSDIFSFSGILTLSFKQLEKGVLVEADTRIEGQFLDWGKSNRILGRLFEGISGKG